MTSQSNRPEFRIFLSSNFDLSTRRNRDLFRTELLSRFNMISGQQGINTFLVDYEYGIPAGTPITDVIDLCISSVKQSNLFFCILNSRYGKPVPFVSLTEKQKELVLNAKHDSKDAISVLELEILAAEAFGIPSVIFIQDKKDREPRLEELISSLIEQHFEMVHFSGIEELADKAQVFFMKFFSNTGCTVFDHDYYLETALAQLIARKLRYYCHNERITSQLNDYVLEGKEKPLQIFGKPGSGKTTCLLNWLVENQQRSDIVIVKWFSEVGPKNSLGALKLLLDQVGIDIDRFNFEEEAIIALHDFWGKPHDICYVFLIDGAEDLVDTKGFLGQLLSADLSANVRVIVSRASPPKNQIDFSAINIAIQPVECEALIETIYRKEWKQLEYSSIKHTAIELNAVEPHLIILIMQQALREIRYINRFEDKKTSPKQIILDRLFAIRSEWDIFIAQKEHLEAIQFPWDIVSSFSLIACSEKGLTIKELSEIIGETPHFVYQFYFILTTDEDLLSLPDTIKTKLLDDIPSEDLMRYRSLLVQYFTVHQSDRATIERYYQMTELNDYKGAAEIVQDLCQWRIIKINSTKPFLSKVLLTRNEQQQTLAAWQKEITASPNKYSEKDKYTAAVSAQEMGFLEEAAMFMQTLIMEANSDLISKASYLQNLADIHDEMDDISAVDDIAASIDCMLQVADQFTAQQMIDVYRAAAEIGSHFAFAETQNAFAFEKPLAEKAKEWIDKVTNLTEREGNKSVYLRNLSYHGVAYSYYNLGEYFLAYKWIQKAVLFSRDGLLNDELVDDLFQKAQICLEWYRENMDNQRLDEADSAITEAASLAQNEAHNWSDYEKRSIVSKILNTWGDILCEKGNDLQADKTEAERRFEQAINKMKEAISLDLENHATDLYMSYYNIAIYYYNAMQVTKKDYFNEGIYYAKLAKKEAERANNAQSDFDMADIFMLLAQLYHEKNQVLLSHRFLWRSMRIHKKYESSICPFPAEQVFPLPSIVDICLFHIDNLFQKCFIFSKQK